LDDFHISGVQRVKVPMMEQTRTFPVVEFEEAYVVDLPYKVCLALKKLF
jgi:serine protease inhibitor